MILGLLHQDLEPPLEILLIGHFVALFCLGFLLTSIVWFGSEDGHFLLSLAFVIPKTTSTCIVPIVVKSEEGVFSMTK